MNDNYKTQRIDTLLDKRIDTIRDNLQGDMQDIKNTVDSIHKILVGNGSEGLLEKVTQNSVRVKVIMWIVGVLFAAIVGSYFG